HPIATFSLLPDFWGVTEIMMDCAMDEGDLSRLLRRTMDVLAQILKFPDSDDP
ncbi:DExH-box ATP-dependent RNA helicase DExH15 chloroplastic, partial [Tanacetum coccineum]